ncbi:MAG: hypothetical protein IMW94_04415 [Thermoanaerobacter sp.]|nr:hypothetical protein [Thermoanaerobacter sp.]
MMKAHDNGIWRYEPVGKDIWGRPVWAAYCLGEFAGYRYRRTRQELARLRREYGPRVGLQEWEDCPDWCVVGGERHGQI